jgi:hypothetical protein
MSQFSKKPGEYPKEWLASEEELKAASLIQKKEIEAMRALFSTRKDAKN